MVSGVRHISQVDHVILKVSVSEYVSGVRHISQVDHDATHSDSVEIVSGVRHISQVDHLRFRCPSYQPGRPPKLKCKFDRKPSALRHAYNRLRRKSRENRCVSHPPFECAAVTTACFRLSESCRQIHIIKFSSAYLQLLPGFMPANCRIGGSFSCYRRILAKFICFNRKFPIFISH